MWSEPCTSSGPEGLVPASSVPYRDTVRGFWAQGWQLAEGQADKKTCAVPKTRASKDAVTSEHACLGWCPSWLAEPEAVRTGVDRLGKSHFSDLG